jgi:hypothetical protein
VDVEGDVLPDRREGLAHAVAGDAAADRVEVPGEGVDAIADTVELGECT